MGNALTVDIIERHENLFEQDCCLWLWEEFVFHDPVEQLSSLTDFCDQVDVLIVDEILEKLKDVGMIKFLEDCNFLLESFHVLDLLLWDDLHCPGLLGLPMSALIDDTETTSSQWLLLLLVLVLELGIVFDDHSFFLDEEVPSSSRCFHN